jgi:hypothetical protein
VGTGIGAWESKLAVERRLRELAVPARHDMTQRTYERLRSAGPR